MNLLLHRKPSPAFRLLVSGALVLLMTWSVGGAESRVFLSLVESVNQALTNNPTLRQAAFDLKANQGVVVQTRAVVFPHLDTIGSFKERDPELIDRTIEQYIPIEQTEHLWTTEVRLVQSVYQGGRLRSALRSAKLLREKALLDHEALVRDVLLHVRIAYANVLATEQKISASQTTVELLEKQAQNMRYRLENDLEPRFSVLRAEVELANAKPDLIQARNAYRITRQQLLHLLGYDLTDGLQLTVVLTDTLKPEPFSTPLAETIQIALKNRVELLALEKDAALRKEGIVTARSGYKPKIEVFGAYGAHNPEYRKDISEHLVGWSAGVQAIWVPFDGLLTQGKIVEAEALYQKSLLQGENLSQEIILDVQIAYSSLVEARELLQSQDKVVEHAEEAARMASARQENGSSTLLDVLSSQSALAQARYTRVESLRNYVTALARLERAMGQ